MSRQKGVIKQIESLPFRLQIRPGSLPMPYSLSRRPARNWVASVGKPFEEFVGPLFFLARTRPVCNIVPPTPPSNYHQSSSDMSSDKRHPSGSADVAGPPSDRFEIDSTGSEGRNPESESPTSQTLPSMSRRTTVFATCLCFGIQLQEGTTDRPQASYLGKAWTGGLSNRKPRAQYTPDS